MAVGVPSGLRKLFARRPAGLKPQACGEAEAEAVAAASKTRASGAAILWSSMVSTRCVRVHLNA